MSNRPEYYSGRGATSGDLNSYILEKVYQGIKAEYGDDAATAFVQLVKNFKVLSATAFLTTFYSFVARGCVYKENESHESHTDVGPDRPQREAIGFATIAGALTGMRTRDETQEIRGQFLSKYDR